jgi:hypothetical protein
VAGWRGGGLCCRGVPFHRELGCGWVVVVGHWYAGFCTQSMVTCTKIVLGAKPFNPSTWKHPGTGSTGPNTGQTRVIC